MMTEDEKKTAGPEAVPPAKPAANEEGMPSQEAKVAPEPAARATAAPEAPYPALLESLAALGLLLVVAYTCWRLYGIEIGRMLGAFLHW